MSTHAPTILVTGATGQQGGAVVRALLQHGGFGIRALTRDPRQPAAQTLAARGIEVVGGDLNDRASLERAAQGVHGVFAVVNYWQAGHDGEIRQGQLLADVACAARVQHFVYSSVAGANRQTGIRHFDSKWRSEQHLRALGLPYTILRPVFFMQNWRRYVRDQVLQGTFPQPLSAHTRLQQIDVNDIGWFAAHAFANPAQALSQELDIAGDELTMFEIAETFSRVFGRPVAYCQESWEQFRAAAGAEMTRMYRWFDEAGTHVDIASLRLLNPLLATLDQVLRRENWLATTNAAAA